MKPTGRTVSSATETLEIWKSIIPSTSKLAELLNIMRGL